MAMLRSPRAHVYSQFLQCKHDEWGLRVTNGTGFPRSGLDTDGFARWIQHFRGGRWRRDGVIDDFGCYNPHNMQAKPASSDAHHLRASRDCFALRMHLFSLWAATRQRLCP